MTMGIDTEIDFSTFPDSDGEPMAENEVNREQMTDLIFGLWQLLAAHGQVHVSGNLLVYYNAANGRDHISPDVFVAFGVERRTRSKWLTWEEGKFPDVVFEITSPSTQDRDLHEKRQLYARLGAHEYYIYDPEQTLVPPFQGFRRVGSGFAPVPPLPSGGIYSPALDTELRVVEGQLRVIDPATGQPIRTPAEEHAGRLAAEERAAQAEAALQAALAALTERDSRASADH